MRAYAETGSALSGSYVQEVIATALCVGESNACMRKIVAAPTGGGLRCAAGGIGTAVSYWRCRGGCGDSSALCLCRNRRSHWSSRQHCRSFRRVSGGDRFASAMASGALTALRGGSAEQIGHAAAMALKNLMGLICDPVAGLVEVPCVKRNVIGAVNAVSCADMAFARITSRIPVDEVIECMGDVGRRMPMEFRETALGGLAATPFGTECEGKNEASSMMNGLQSKRAAVRLRTAAL